MASDGNINTWPLHKVSIVHVVCTAHNLYMYKYLAINKTLPVITPVNTLAFFLYQLAFLCSSAAFSSTTWDEC